MMTRRAFFAAEAVLNFLLASRKLLSHAETLIKKGEQNSGPTKGYTVCAFAAEKQAAALLLLQYSVV